MFTRYDKSVICFFVLMAVLSFGLSGYVVKAGGNKASVAVVSASGNNQLSYSLDENRRIKIKGILGTSIVEISSEDGVRMVDSPCLEKVCLAHGWVKRPGEVIVCAPNRVVIKITGENKLKVDAVSK